MEHTVTGQRLIERGFERGLEEGRTEGRRLNVLKVLDARFGPPPAHIVDRVNATAAEELESVLISAATAATLEVFASQWAGEP